MPKTKETHEGYTIVQAETYDQTNDQFFKTENRIVFGEKRTDDKVQFAVWHNNRGLYHAGTDRETPFNNYYYEHYYDDKKKALAYYHGTLSLIYKGYNA